MKLKPQLTGLGISKKEREEYDKQAKDAYERLKQRYLENKNKDGK